MLNKFASRNDFARALRLWSVTSTSQKKLRLCGATLIGLLALTPMYAQTPVPSPSPAPTPISKTGSILVNNPSTVGRISKWVGSSNNGIGTIGDSVITESAMGTIGIGTNPFNDFKLAVDGGNTFGGLFGQSVYRAGVHGSSPFSYGVLGKSVNSYGVFGNSINSFGVAGFSNNTYGVYGFSNSSYGVYGSSNTGLAGAFEGKVNVSGLLSAGSLSLNPGGSLKFADNTIQTTAATITGVTAGTGLTGGGTAGNVTVGLAAGGVNTSQLADASVTGAKLSAGAVGTTNLADNAVNTNHLVDSAVTSGKISDGAVTDTKISPQSIKTSHLASDFALSQSQVTNLTADLASKATDSGVVHLAGAETITGAKTFSNTQFFSGNVGIGMVQPNASELLKVEANTGAVAGTFVNNHNTNSNDALYAVHTGFGNAIHAVNTQANGRAGFFELSSSLGAVALESKSVGNGPAFKATNTGGGLAGLFGGDVTITGGLTLSGVLNSPFLTNPGTLNAASNPVDWTKLKGVPTSLASGQYVNSLNGLFGNVSLAAGDNVSITPNGNMLTIASTFSGSDFVARTGDTMTGTLNLPANGLRVGTNQLVLSNGNVGIGTSVPTRPLEVFAADGEAARLYRNVNFRDNGVNIKFALNNSNNVPVDYAGVHGQIVDSAAGGEGGNLILSTATNGLLTEKMRLTPSGNAGIGTMSPQARLHVVTGGNAAGQFDGNVTVNGNLTVTGSTNLAASVAHDSTLTGNGSAASPLSVVSAPNGVVTTGSYTNPSWITSLDGTKLTAGTVVKSINGITDNATLAAGDNVTITPSGSTLTISAGIQPQYNFNQVALLRWYDANTTNAVFSVGNKPIGLAFDGSSMWVANLNSDNVMKLRASDGAILGTYAVGSLPAEIAFDGANIWVTNHGGGSVTRLKASDGTVFGTYTVGSNPFGIAFDGANMWVANSASGSIMKLRANDGVNMGTFTVGASPTGVAFDGANIWVTNHTGNNLWKLQASDGALLGNYVVGSNPYGIAFDGANMWVANENSNNVMKLRISDGVVLGTFAVGNVPRSVVFDGVNIWVSNAYSGDVTKLRASDGAVLGTYPVGSFPERVAFDGANIWVANGGSNNVMKR